MRAAISDFQVQVQLLRRADDIDVDAALLDLGTDVLWKDHLAFIFPRTAFNRVLSSSVFQRGICTSGALYRRHVVCAHAISLRF